VQLGQTIYGNATGDQLGWLVNASAEGNTIVLSLPGYYVYTDRPGYMRVFSLHSKTKLTPALGSQIGQDIIREAMGDEFGYSVTISAHGQTLAVGDNANNGKNRMDVGHVRIYSLADDGQAGNRLQGY
jgi:hypothetical protein